jgi:hypothetical protein
MRGAVVQHPSPLVTGLARDVDRLEIEGGRLAASPVLPHAVNGLEESLVERTRDRLGVALPEQAQAIEIARGHAGVREQDRATVAGLRNPRDPDAPREEEELHQQALAPR